MKKQNYKLYVMAFLFTAFAFISTTSAFAQSEMPMTVNISFEFYVGNKLFSAGDYNMMRVRDGAFLIRSATGSDNIIVPTPSSGRIRQNVKSEQIVFTRYGDKYFLRQIFSNRNANGFALAKSRTERHTQREFLSDKKKLTKSSNFEQVAVQFKN